MNDDLAVLNVLSKSSFFITAYHKFCANKKIERPKICSFEDAVAYSRSILVKPLMLVSLTPCVTEENRVSREQRERVHYAETPPIKAKKRLHSNPRRVNHIIFSTRLPIIFAFLV